MTNDHRLEYDQGIINRNRVAKHRALSMVSETSRDVEYSSGIIVVSRE